MGAHWGQAGSGEEMGEVGWLALPSIRAGCDQEWAGGGGRGHRRLGGPIGGWLVITVCVIVTGHPGHLAFIYRYIFLLSFLNWLTLI